MTMGGLARLLLCFSPILALRSEYTMVYSGSITEEINTRLSDVVDLQYQHDVQSKKKRHRLAATANLISRLTKEHKHLCQYQKSIPAPIKSKDPIRSPEKILQLWNVDYVLAKAFGAVVQLPKRDFVLEHILFSSYAYLDGVLSRTGFCTQMNNLLVVIDMFFRFKYKPSQDLRNVLTPEQVSVFEERMDRYSHLQFDNPKIYRWYYDYHVKVLLGVKAFDSTGRVQRVLELYSLQKI